MKVSTLMIKNLNHQKFDCLSTALSETGKTLQFTNCRAFKKHDTLTPVF
tara:strand:- start:355 stop:501 length:147 start_codon:yes stop_codon:yes gene_type:complete